MKIRRRGSKGRSRLPIEEYIAVSSTGNGGGMEQGGTSKSIEKRSTFGYILKVGLKAFANGLDVGYERKKIQA